MFGSAYNDRHVHTTYPRYPGVHRLHVEPLTLTPLYLPVTLPTRQWVSRGRVGCVPR